MGRNEFKSLEDVFGMSLEELKDAIEELGYSLDDLDDLEILANCSGTCTKCQGTCQNCQSSCEKNS